MGVTFCTKHCPTAHGDSLKTKRRLTPSLDDLAPDRPTSTRASLTQHRHRNVTDQSCGATALCQPRADSDIHGLVMPITAGRRRGCSKAATLRSDLILVRKRQPSAMLPSIVPGRAAP